MIETKTKERPILFQGPMVTALREGLKTQTRRIVKMTDASRYAFRELKDGRAIFDLIPGTPVKTGRGESTRLWLPTFGVNCPYGEPGDRLWVRESAWYDRVDFLGVRCFFTDDSTAIIERDQVVEKTPFPISENLMIANRAQRKRPSIHMPRWASRIDLLIESVRVERLLDITEEDAIAEGAEKITYGCAGTLEGYRALPGAMIASHVLARDWYKSLWDSINGPGSWASNTWCWCVGFKVIRGLA